MARRQGGLLEFDANTMDRWSKEMAAVSTLFDDPLEGLFQFDHPNSCLDLSDRSLLSPQI